MVIRSNTPFLGIQSFAPEFWRLVAEEPKSSPEAPPVQPIPIPQPSPRLPPLTNDALEAYRESLGGFGNSLRDIPPPPVPVYPAFTGKQPPLTNEGLRALRNPETGSGDLQDIPEGPLSPVHTPLPADQELERIVVSKIKKANELRSTLERLEAEKRKPERRRDLAEFEKEIEKTSQAIAGVEADIGEYARRLPRHFPGV